jgi:1,4-dihydroxy-2-naphthoate octaprenyltransferase
MADAAQWISGARLRTLPLALAPVLIGTGAAIGSLGGFTAFILDDLSGGDDHVSLGQILLRGFLALLVSLCLQIGSNYANDYSDGIRGTDDERVGPVPPDGDRAAPSRARSNVPPSSSSASPGSSGIVLILVSQAWWFLIVGSRRRRRSLVLHRRQDARTATWASARSSSSSSSASWPPWARCGCRSATSASAAGPVPWRSGRLASAVLMVNNLRDIPTDIEAGKITLAVRLGDNAARIAYAVLVLLPFALLALAILDGHPAAALAILALVPALNPLKTVLSGTTGPGLIPPIKSTGLTGLAFAALMGLGLAL